jgi:hypothetical protein
MSYSKEEFTEIMVLAVRIEHIIDGQDMVTSLLAMTVVLARGGRILDQKSGGEFSKGDLIEMVVEKIDYWTEFYDHLESVGKLEKRIEQ